MAQPGLIRRSLSRPFARIAVLGGLLAAAGIAAASPEWTTLLARAIVQAPNAGRRIDPADDPGPEKLARLGVDRQMRIEVGPPAASLSAWVFEPAGEWAGRPRGTIFLLHGIRDRKTSMLGLARAFAAEGYRAVPLDLRGHGRSSGEWLTFGLTESRDLSQAADALEAGGLVGGPIGVYGYSYGGAVAIQWAATDPRVRAVVAVAPFTSLPDVVPLYVRGALPIVGSLAPEPWIRGALGGAGSLASFEPSEASALRAIGKTSAPVLLLHGKRDRRIPFPQSEALHAAAPDRSRLILLEDEGHLSIGRDRRGLLARESVAWFDRRLREP